MSGNARGVELRLFGAAVLVSSWLLLLLVGWALGGGVHLLLLAAVALTPWRQMARDLARPVELPESAMPEPAAPDPAVPDKGRTESGEPVPGKLEPVGDTATSAGPAAAREAERG